MKIFSNLIFFVIFLFPFCSCSIKESRDSCPCLLLLEFEDRNMPETESLDLMVFSQGDYVWTDTVSISDTMTQYAVRVPKTELHIGVWAGLSGRDTSGGLDIPLGCECPKVYMYDADMVAAGETVAENVVLRKNHCILTVLTKGGNDFPFRMKVTGNVSGYSRDGRPVSGEFSYYLPKRAPGNEFSVVLPRQADSSLMLHVLDYNENIKSFSLGHYIAESGYDWSVPDLEDMTVTIDYALTEISLSVAGWDEVYSYDMVF